MWGKVLGLVHGVSAHPEVWVPVVIAAAVVAWLVAFLCFAVWEFGRDLLDDWHDHELEQIETKAYREHRGRRIKE